MKFEDWKPRAMACMLGDLPLICKATGIAGESGEVMELIKKRERKKNYEVRVNDLMTNSETSEISDEFKKKLGGECLDVMWYLTAIADHYGVDLGQAMQDNLDKLEGRKARDVVAGIGENR